MQIALGTDGANCGGSVNMFESMKLAAILHNPHEPEPDNWIRPAEVFRMATLNSAMSAGMAQETGSLEKGKKADLVILNPRRSFSMIPPDQPLRQLVFSESGSSVETVMVQGKVVVDRGRITTFDEEKVYDEVKKRAAHMMERFLHIKGKIDEQASFLRKSLRENKRSD